MSYEVQILADSISPDGVRLTTMRTVYPRFIHSEMLRHRVFSHSVASSRAIPTERYIEQVETNPFIPETFNTRVKGMGVGEALTVEDAFGPQQVWAMAAGNAVNAAKQLLHIDKSRANRLLEPFIWATDIISATEWDNFFALRDNPDAQIEFQVLAKMMRKALEDSTPLELDYGQWHLPGLTTREIDFIRIGEYVVDYWKFVAAGRLARWSSYENTAPEPHSDSNNRGHKLAGGGHMSPFEHIARPATETDSYVHGCGDYFGNFKNWIQMRKEFKHEDRFDLLMESNEDSSN